MFCCFVRVVSPAKTAEPIKMMFWMWTWVGPRKHVSDGGVHNGATLRIRLNRPYDFDHLFDVLNHKPERNV